jgi:CHAT domain-containing protein/Tfp pilus assembly protein PilF
MKSRVALVAVLLLLPLMAVAQPASREIKTKPDLAAALCRVQSERSTEALLDAYPILVDGQLWETVTDRAIAAFYQESPQRALSLYEVSVQIATKLHDPKLLAKTHYNLARTFSGLNQPDKAVESYERSRKYFEQAGLKRDLIYVLADLGAIFFNKEDYQSAQTYSEQSLLIADSAKSIDVPAGSYPDDFGRARALQTLAEIDVRNGRQERAIERLQRSLELFQELNGQDSNYAYYVAGVFAALGRVYPEIGDYDRALYYLKKASDSATTSFNQNLNANILNSIGFLYMEQEDYAQAKEHFERSLKIFLAVNNPIESSKVLLNLGVVEQRQAHYNEALTQFKLSLQAAKSHKLSDVQIAAGEGIGVVLTAKKDFERALEVLEESLTLAKETKNKTREIELMWRLSEAYREMGNYERATAFAEGSVTLAHSRRLPKLEFLAATTLGQTYGAQKDFEKAIQTLQQAAALLEAMRDQVAGSEVESQLFLANKVAAYHSLVDVFIKQDKPVDALLSAERAKGRVLLDVMSGGKPELSKILTTDERARMQSLNRTILDINNNIKAQGSVASSLDSLYRQLDTARLEYQSFEDGLFVSHPDLRIRAGLTTTLTSADVSRLALDKSRGYLEFVVGDEQVYLFVLTTKNGTDLPELRAYPLAIKTEDLAQEVNEFHQRLADRHPDFRSISRELYATLIEPASKQLQGVSTICVVPDRVLWNLPFQALITTSNRYLIEDFALYYAPSLSVLREMNKDRPKAQKGDDSLLALGNPVIGQNDQRKEDLCPLPEAETEVTSIAKTFGARNKKVLIGRAATEQSFKTLASTYGTIHLATHGIIDNRHPLYSHLLLTKSDNDAENDGSLEAREIMNMMLNANLAVLSACETANGRISPGEGVMGTSWAFFVAGTRSMLVSQWKVNSSSTSELMRGFYQALEPAKTGGKAASLQQATLRLMRDDRYRHPFYWAGFILVGTN